MRDENRGKTDLVNLRLFKMSDSGETSHDDRIGLVNNDNDGQRPERNTEHSTTNLETLMHLFKVHLLKNL